MTTAKKRKRKGWDRRAPYSARTGDLLTWDPGRHDAGVEWRDVAEFEATLTFERIDFDVHAVFRDEKGARYSMFARDFEQIIPSLMDGWVHGRWIVAKRGTKYGVVPVGRLRRQEGQAE